MTLNMNGFVFPVDSLFDGLFDSYFNTCTLLTVGVGDKIPVRVRVRQSATVGQGQNETTPLVVTVQQAAVSVPQQQGVQNPVRARQSSGNNEVIVGEISTAGNQALQSLGQSQQQEVGVTLLIPQGIQQAPHQTANIVRSLGKEIAAISATEAQLAREAVQVAASGVDDAAILISKLKNLPSQQVQQLLQKSNLPFQIAKSIVENLGNPQAAAILRQQGISVVLQLNREVTHQAQRVVASLC